MVAIEINDGKDAECTSVLAQLEIKLCSQERGRALQGTILAGGWLWQLTNRVPRRNPGPKEAVMIPDVIIREALTAVRGGYICAGC